MLLLFYDYKLPTFSRQGLRYIFVHANYRPYNQFRLLSKFSVISLSSAQQLAELRGLERGTHKKAAWKSQPMEGRQSTSFKCVELYCLINISMEKKWWKRPDAKKTVQGRFVLTCQKLLFS